MPTNKGKKKNGGIMRTTFLNDNREGNLKATAKDYLKGRIEDFEIFMENIKGNEDIGPFSEYGLCFDYVEPGTFKGQRKGYHRYQMSYGGPSDEIRFYSNGKIEYVYLDWFCGVGFDVTKEDWAIWLKDRFIANLRPIG